MTGAQRDIPRRGLLAATGLASAVVLTAAQAGPGRPASGFHGEHQDGIASAPLPFLSIAGFDVVNSQRSDLISLLRTWTQVAGDLALPAGGALTFTFGFGPSLFAADGLGINERRPSALAPLPPFAGESLDPANGGGDICVQACATTPTAAHSAIRALVNTGRAKAALRWRQSGFRDVAEGGAGDPVGMFGFRDGTANLDVHDRAQTEQHLWVGDGPAWLRGGTYLIVRRIRLLLDTWDRTAIADQETIIGRRRATNRRMHDASPTAHTRLASPHANGGVKLLRRSFSYDAGTDPNGLMDTGLIFISFQKDPQQFIAVQQRLSRHDPLNGFSQHLTSGVYACPPGITNGSSIGEQLLA